MRGVEIGSEAVTNRERRTMGREREKERERGRKCIAL